jgi:hypothetical protein
VKCLFNTSGCSFPYSRWRLINIGIDFSFIPIEIFQQFSSKGKNFNGKKLEIISKIKAKIRTLLKEKKVELSKIKESS